ncbi:hypothetical protein EV421DRAFT_2033263 [Armillaria borealis]|uniref:Uncharacterized protein n=1 Tax=Armillaria borealis TaxID=47425 RepID=A0AA39MVC2_9AGAR|nr:hypothetical protein EV421DRAFT_2033263 [Armillaria borealis]
MQHYDIEANHFHEMLGDPRTMFDVPSSIKNQVRQRDRDRCLFTGNHPPGRTSVSWIVPPYAYQEVFPPTDPRINFGLDRKDLRVLPNATLLCKELIPYFQDNVFSVDINNNYRVIIFRETGSAHQLLPTYMPRPSSQDSQFEMFLRAYFYTSLRANLLGGDIREDYPRAAIVKMMGQLDVGGDDSDDEMVPLSDLRWLTVLGQAIWEEVMRDRIAEAS